MLAHCMGENADLDAGIEWSATRKGRPPAWEALEALCTDGPGSPCPLFTSAQSLVRRLGAHMREETEAPRVVALSSTPLQLELVQWLVQTHGWKASVLVERGRAPGSPSGHVSTTAPDAAAVAGPRAATLLLPVDPSARPR